MDKEILDGKLLEQLRWELMRMVAMVAGRVKAEDSGGEEIRVEEEPEGRVQGAVSPSP